MAATRAAWSAMFRRAQSTAAGDSSTAMTRLPGQARVAIDRASAADPEQRSTTNGPRPAAGRDAPAGRRGSARRPPDPTPARARSPSAANPSTWSTISSVSGRGMNTPGPDAQLEVAERGKAGQVLQRDPLDPLGDERGEGVGLLVGDRAPGHPQQGARPTGDVRKQQLGVHLRRGHTRGSQLGGGSRQKIPGRLHRSTLFLLTCPVGLPADSRAAPWTDRIRTTSGTIRTPVSDLRHSALRRQGTLPQHIGSVPPADRGSRLGGPGRQTGAHAGLLLPTDRRIPHRPRHADCPGALDPAHHRTLGGWATACGAALGTAHPGGPPPWWAASAPLFRRGSASTSLAPCPSPTWCSQPGRCARVAGWRWPRRRWPRPTPPTGRS